MAGIEHGDPDGRQAVALCKRVSKVFHGTEQAIVLSVLTTMAAIVLEDSGVSESVFVAQLHASIALLRRKRAR